MMVKKDIPKILNNYANKDNRIKIINQENLGPAAARNTGLKLANGKFIAFVDSDDYIDKNTYENALKYINKYDLVCFGIEIFGDAYLEYRQTDIKYYKIKYDKEQIINNEIILNTDVSLCNKIFKKEIINKYKIEFTNGFLYEDAEFYFKYIVCCKNIYFIDKYFYHYRRSNNSIMSQTFNGSEDSIHHLYISEHIFNFYKKHNFFDKKENIVLFEKIFCDFFRFSFANCIPITENIYKIFYTASKLALKFDEVLHSNKNIIKNLKIEKYSDVFKPDLKLFQKIFSINNACEPFSKNIRKYIYIFGFCIKTTNKTKNILRKINSLEQENIKLRIELKKY